LSDLNGIFCDYRSFAIIMNDEYMIWDCLYIWDWVEIGLC